MLTLSQRKAYEFVRDFINQHQYSPTTAEIAEGIGIKSRGVVHRYLKALAKSGKIKLIPHRHRNIQLIDEFSYQDHISNGLPLVGVIAAGQPLEAFEESEFYDLVNIFCGKDRFALRVKGDSMVDEGIQDGDIVVCERAEYAANGKIVVALIDQQEATLKRFYLHSDNTVRLMPANASMKPLVFSADRITIQGIYIGLLRIG